MSLDEAALVEDVRARLFAASSSSRTIGAELELIPVFSESRLPVPIVARGAACSSQVIRKIAGKAGWTESAGNSAPCWDLPGGARISFEPGGQIEISSAPHASCSRLISSLQEVVSLIGDAAAEVGIELLATGVDPYNGIEAVPLQLDADRYMRMTRYFEARGEFGIRMMRQTAALQISVEHGERPLERWTLLNSLAPYMVALFASSSRYALRETGHASYRAHLWRRLDESRTGIPFDSADPAGAYARFALAAGALRAENGSGEFHSFSSLLQEEEVAMEDWQFHLSTLFPEVRPKEYFEIRSADALPASDLAAPLAFVAGLVYDDSASRQALQLLGAPDETLLSVAGREGLSNRSLRARAREIVEISVDGASRLPADYLSRADKDDAAKWLRQRLR